MFLSRSVYFNCKLIKLGQSIVQQARNIDFGHTLYAIHVCLSGIGFGASQSLYYHYTHALRLGSLRRSLLTAGGPEQSKCLKSKPQKRYARAPPL
jgi:hypothetical protein